MTVSPAEIPLRQAASLRRKLSAWFAIHGRSLPWREGYDTYRVWISEIMLQQTQVETMLPYYRRWMRRFPDVASVAAAGEEEILKAWEGLGYYSRARNLHRAAGEMMTVHQGRVPAAPEALLALPGIGRYTAGAIASIGFNRPAAAVDGNVGRVLARLFALNHPIRSGEGQRLLWAWAEALVPRKNARDFNQGLMELGALVCRPRAPSCGQCPWRAHCRALQGAAEAGSPEAYPVPSPRRERPLRAGAMILLRDPHRRLLLRKRPPGGVWGGLWEPPWMELEEGEEPSAAAHRMLAELEPGQASSPAGIGAVGHGLTHFQLRLECFAVRLEPNAGAGRPSAPETAGADLCWAGPRQIAALPLPRIAHKALALEQGRNGR